MPRCDVTSFPKRQPVTIMNAELLTSIATLSTSHNRPPPSSSSQKSLKNNTAVHSSASICSIETMSIL